MASNDNSNSNSKLHAIMVSFHLQGHITPFVNLALKLASNGFTVTFAHLDFIHHKISRSEEEADVFSKARSSGLNIHYTTYSDGLPLDFDRDGNLDVYLDVFLHTIPRFVDELVGKIIEGSPPSDNHFLVADTFCIWPAVVAKKYGLVNVSFWTEPAIVFSLYYHWKLLKERGHFPVNGRRAAVDYIPGIRSINTRDFMSYFHETELTPMHEVIFMAFDKVREADFILCNTVHELEAETISALHRSQPFYAVGPIFPDDSTKDLVVTSVLPESESAAWLRDKEKGSVLYVSFGSFAATEERVILEIAGGLLLSEVSFVWVLRPGIVSSSVGEVLPEGFEEKVRGRGLILPWCNQRSVLSDSAVGGFLTHCGWNSILESVVCGVPMICYPLFTDQITNRKLVVDDWRVGINLCDDDDILTKELVCEKIQSMMSGERSEDLRREIENVRRIVNDASGEERFQSFVKDLSAEISNKESTKKML